LIRKFFGWNKKICAALQEHLPYRKKHFRLHYLDAMREYINSFPGGRVVDIGGGEECPFTNFRDPTADVKIIAVDILPEALEKNQDVDEKVVADVEVELPFPDSSVDMVTSRTVLEHLKDNDAFFAKSARILKDGGYFIHIFPTKYALFSMLNQLFGTKFGPKVLFFFFPENSGAGFPAYYDKCTYSGMKKLLDKHGFEIVNLECMFYQSWYFAFFLPLFLVSVAYEWLMYLLGARDLCAYLLIIARKRPTPK